jgi:DNA-binding CsgD family transcriptional regulator
MGRAVACDRNDELAALDAAISDGIERGALIVVRGHAGIGKSTLLEAAARRWRAGKLQVIDARLDWNGPYADPFGFRLVVEAVREHFEQIGEPRLVDSVSALSRLCDPSPGSAEVQPYPLVLELANAFDLISNLRPTVLVVDDVHLLAAPALGLGTVCRPGCVVVVAGRDDPEVAPGLAQLLDMADLVVDLAALPDTRIEAMVAGVRGAPVDEAVLAALRRWLGPLFGNPGTVRSTLDDLELRGRFATVHGQLCLVGLREPIMLADGHDTLVRVHRLGRMATRLATTVAVADLSVDLLPLLAAATGEQATEYGQTVDRLIDVGVLRIDGAGLIRCACPALAAKLADVAGPAAVRAIHLELAEQLRARWRAGDRVDMTMLANQVAAAGKAMPPDPDLATVVERLALDTPGPDAACWWEAARWHASGEPAVHARVLEHQVSALVRAGAYRQLSAVVDSVLHDTVVLAGLETSQRDDLAAAVVLAAVHTGTPLSARTAAALTSPTMASSSEAGPVARRLCERWFTGATSIEHGLPPTVTVAPAPDAGGVPWAAQRPPLLAYEEVLRIAKALDGRPAEPGTQTGGDEHLAAAGALGDLVTVLGVVMGERYGPPVDGPLAAYRRVAHGYAAGDFPAGLAAARELELSGGSDTPAHHTGRLLAAEMYVLRGEFKRAAGWLAAVPAEVGCRALRAWVECELLYRLKGDAGAAFDLGWRLLAETRAHEAQPGLAQLLPRLGRLAMRSGRQREADEVLAEARRLAEGDHRPFVTEMTLLTTALVRRDLTAAKGSVDLARQRGNRPALMHACLVAAELSKEPRPWLREAYELARPFGSAYSRSRISTIMRQRGMSAPRSRTPRAAYSVVELRIIELIRDGWTNRQIAMEIRMSEKTIENYLTRLFARTGCRSRVELAAASLAGQLADVAV